MREVVIYIEEHQQQLYAWRSRDHRFLGQSTTVKGLFERLAEQARANTLFQIEKERGGQLIQQRLLTEDPDGAILKPIEQRDD
jgi:hypothetical protein